VIRSPLKTSIALLAGCGALFVVAMPPSPPPPLAAHPWTPTATAGAASGEVEVARDRRIAWTLRTPGHLALQAAVPPEASLRFAWSVAPADAAVRLRVQREVAGRLETLHEEVWAGGQRWVERQIDLRRFVGQDVDLELAADGPAAAVSISHPALVGRAAKAPGPSVVLYVVDCLRADHVGAYGYPRPTTPEIDRLARDGLVFESVRACASWTKPAVGCLFTSLYPVFHGAQTVDDVLDSDKPTLAEAFRSRGYATAAWVANPFVAANPFGLTRGFERVVQVIDKPPLVNINDLPADAADITRQVVPWLKQNGDRPFFLYLHSLDLHAEYRRRPPFAQRFVSRERTGDAHQLDLYDNELASNDREIGHLLEALKREGLYDRTIVAITADHGEEFGEHGFTRHGHTLFDSLLQVPLVVKLPASARRGQRIAALAASIDIAPTLLDFAGLPAPQGFQGASLRPAVEGRAEPAHPVVFAEQLSPKEVLYAGTDGRFKYIYQLIPSPKEMLFDLASDPGETRDLLASAPDATRGLKSEVLNFMQLGQAGYHVSVGGGDPKASFRLEATSEAPFGDVQRFALATGETLTISPDRRRLDYSFPSGGVAHHLVLRTEPPGAPVQIGIAKAGHPVAPLDVALGADGRHPDAVPFTATPEALTVSLAQGAELLKPEGAPVKLWFIQAPSTGRKATIDPDLQQKLKALGYIE
jgi:arylsulfatase A-like enzyme